jgi:adenylate cyclase
MGLKDNLIADVSNILTKDWYIRNGQVIPFTEDVLLAGGAVKLEATMLYADLADSTELAMRYDKRIVAKVFKSFLTCSSRLIRARGGEIRSFDGDRVMDIFIGDTKNTDAAKCALQINYAFLNIIKPKLEAKYSNLATGSYKLAHCVGVDTSEVLVVRGGVPNNNDLVWIGRSPNVAAKMSGIRKRPYYSFITAKVYNSMTKTVKYAPGSGNPMWEKMTWKAVEGISDIYGSSWIWEP